MLKITKSFLILLPLFFCTDVYARGGGRSQSSNVGRGQNSYYASPVAVRSYVNSNGTFIQNHKRTLPNSTKFDNYSTKGNVNPYTGRSGTKNPYHLNY